ncbi:MAG TPA: type II CAAX endopeptidase family protein [Cellvibrionaceae bacterium]
MLQTIHPRRIFQALDEIDQASPSYSLSRPKALRRVFWTLACVSVCLLLLHYGKNSSILREALVVVAHVTGSDSANWWRSWQSSGVLSLIGYLWWSSMHLFTFVLLPWLFIRLVLKEKLIDHGWRWNDTHKHWLEYLLLATPILLFVYLVSLGDDFVNHYPFYQHAGRSWADLIAWQVLYIGQFIFLEFFFRGFMLNALRPAMGANAVWVMCVPYMMIHLPKLPLEATGAILFGLFLGILALLSRSIWGGVMVHVSIALSMDLAALYRKSEIPLK